MTGELAENIDRIWNDEQIPTIMKNSQRERHGPLHAQKYAKRTNKHDLKNFISYINIFKSRDGTERKKQGFGAAHEPPKRPAQKRERNDW